MTDDEAAQFEILKLATEEGKFAVAVGGAFKTTLLQDAFERLMTRGWIRLIDITPLASGERAGRLYRVFLASDEAMSWFRSKH